MTDDAKLAEALRELAAQMRSESAQEIRELRGTVDRLEKTVGRFVVACERILASNDQRQERARKAIANMHPDMDRIQREVAAKVRGRR